MERKCNWCNTKYETPPLEDFIELEDFLLLPADLQGEEELEEREKYCSDSCYARGVIDELFLLAQDGGGGIKMCY